MVEKIGKGTRDFFKSNVKILCCLILLLIFILVAQHLGIDKKITIFTVLFFGYVTQLFAVLVGYIAAIPVIGAPIANIISLPFIFIVNAIAYMVTFFSLRKGYAKEVLGSRVLVTAFIVGLILGYALGKLI